MPGLGDAALCPLCEGRGFTGFDVPVEDPRFGTLAPCLACRGQPADYNPPEPRPPGGGSDYIDFPVSADFARFYAALGQMPHYAWMDGPLPGEAAPTAAQRRAAAQIEADSHRLSQIPLAQILRPLLEKERPPAPPRMTRPKA